MTVRKALLVAGLCTLPAMPVSGQEPVRYVHGWIGGASGSGAWTIDTDDAATLEGDLGTLPWGGGTARTFHGDLPVAFEAGGLFTYRNDDVRFAAAFTGGETTLRAAVDNRFFAFEIFMGGVVAVSPVRGVRFYAAAGPTLAWANIKSDEIGDTAVVGSTNGLRVDLSQRDNRFSAAFYGAAGIEYESPAGWTVGASARRTDHRFDFGSSGKIRLDAVQWFLTLGRRL